VRNEQNQESHQQKKGKGTMKEMSQENNWEVERKKMKEGGKRARVGVEVDIREEGGVGPRLGHLMMEQFVIGEKLGAGRVVLAMHPTPNHSPQLTDSEAALFNSKSKSPAVPALADVEAGDINNVGWSIIPPMIGAAGCCKRGVLTSVVLRVRRKCLL
jgi:hypothetical protein